MDGQMGGWMIGPYYKYVLILDIEGYIICPYIIY